MAYFTDDQSKVHNLGALELGNSNTPTKEIANIALDLASHCKALLGTIFEQALASDRDKTLDSLSSGIAAIKSISSKA